MRPSNLCNGNFCTYKTASLYWDGPLKIKRQDNFRCRRWRQGWLPDNSHVWFPWMNIRQSSQNTSYSDGDFTQVKNIILFKVTPENHFINMDK